MPDRASADTNAAEASFGLAEVGSRESSLIETAVRRGFVRTCMVAFPVAALQCTSAAAAAQLSNLVCLPVTSSLRDKHLGLLPGSLLDFDRRPLDWTWGGAEGTLTWAARGSPLDEQQIPTLLWPGSGRERSVPVLGCLGAGRVELVPYGDSEVRLAWGGVCKL